MKLEYRQPVKRQSVVTSMEVDRENEFPPSIRIVWLLLTCSQLTHTTKF